RHQASPLEVAETAKEKKEREKFEKRFPPNDFSALGREGLKRAKFKMATAGGNKLPEPAWHSAAIAIAKRCSKPVSVRALANYVDGLRDELPAGDQLHDKRQIERVIAKAVNASKLKIKTRHLPTRRRG